MVPLVRILIADDQRPPHLVLQVDMPRQFATADPTLMIRIEVVTRIGMKVDTGERVIVIVVHTPRHIVVEVAAIPVIAVMGAVCTATQAEQHYAGQENETRLPVHQSIPSVTLMTG
jgi:hypothetical protein